MSTRERLLDTAESLFLSRGIDQVSLREIARAAGQRNPSALHYHFGSRQELVDAMVARRYQQQEERRARLLREAEAQGDPISVRQICEINVGTPFALCREDRSFRDLLGVMGLHLLASNYDYFAAEPSANTPSLSALWQQGEQALRHLPPEILALRLENAYGTVMLAISRRAGSKGSFRGRAADMFFYNLVDQVTAMMEAPLSEDTADSCPQR